MSDTFKTAEIRWFIVGFIPEKIKKRLDLRIFKNQPEREDIYLKTDDGKNTGVKIREERLEIKTLLSMTGKHISYKKISGEIGLWIKIGSLLKKESQSLFKGNEIRVRKKRSILGLQYKKSKIIPYHYDLINLASGCMIEVSEIKIMKNNYWSINLECWNTDEDPAISLVDYASFAFTKYLSVFQKNSYLTDQNCLSYPEFLGSLHY